MMHYWGSPSSRKDIRKGPGTRHGNSESQASNAPRAVPSLRPMLLATDPQAEIKGKDRALLKEIADLEEDEANQVRKMNHTLAPFSDTK